MLQLYSNVEQYGKLSIFKRGFRPSINNHFFDIARVANILFGIMDIVGIEKLDKNLPDIFTAEVMSYHNVLRNMLRLGLRDIVLLSSFENGKMEEDADRYAQLSEKFSCLSEDLFSSLCKMINSE